MDNHNDLHSVTEMFRFYFYLCLSVLFSVSLMFFLQESCNNISWRFLPLIAFHLSVRVIHFSFFFHCSASYNFLLIITRNISLLLLATFDVPLILFLLALPFLFMFWFWFWFCFWFLFKKCRGINFSKDGTCLFLYSAAKIASRSLVRVRKEKSGWRV